MYQLYLDAMALPMRYHKPDLFITVTCNPKWPEISAAIPLGSHWRHHQDICARVFALKFQSMLSDLVDQELFGKVQAVVYRIEWQVFETESRDCDSSDNPGSYCFAI